ncbi:FecR family protein [Alistipes sp. OttesenSCG-928-L06]|nr:FecR family protein [Alistipes sp. OttesenSCG-928-L06]
MTGTNNILKDFNELTSAERTELLVGAMLDMEISDELLARLQRWFLEEGDEQAKREAFLKYSQATVVPNADGPSRATRRRYMELAGKLGFEPERKRARKVWSRTGIWGSIAASLLLAVAAGYLWLSRTADPGVLVATSTVSERVILPDSSLVVVEPNSSLSYHRSFEEGREVDLDGEAFFRVKGDPDEIFTVNASDIRVRVYGTDFKVISRAGAADYCVSLFKGRVSGINRLRCTEHHPIHRLCDRPARKG